MFIKHHFNEKVLAELPLMPLSTHTWCHNGEICEVIYSQGSLHVCYDAW